MARKFFLFALALAAFGLATSARADSSLGESGATYQQSKVAAPQADTKQISGQMGEVAPVSTL